MRLFWSMFFLGSMLLVGLDVRERRQAAQTQVEAPVANGPEGVPTPRP
jgi:hypothetical protein